MKEQHITDRDAGQRIDKYLRKLFRNATSGFLFKMMRKKNITLNKKKTDGKDILKVGDSIQIYFSDETYDKMCGKAEKTSYYEELKSISYEHIQVIYEDADMMVLNKPAGILSQKSKEEDISINEEMLSYLIAKGDVTEETLQTFRPSVANRLDRNTSGVLLCGKTLKGQQYLSSCLNDRSLVKLYHCIVLGEVTSPERLEGYLTKDANNVVHLSKHPVSGDSKEIKTAYKPLFHSKYISELEVHLITGRTHQIRAHLSSIQHSILGDPKYGVKSWNQKLRKEFGYPFQLLHAYSVTFPDGREFIAEEPAIYHKILKRYE